MKGRERFRSRPRPRFRWERGSREKSGSALRSTNPTIIEARLLNFDSGSNDTPRSRSPFLPVIRNTRIKIRRVSPPHARVSRIPIHRSICIIDNRTREEGGRRERRLARCRWITQLYDTPVELRVIKLRVKSRAAISGEYLSRNKVSKREG